MSRRDRRNPRSSGASEPISITRDLFTERLGPDQARQGSVFIDQMTTLLDTKSTTSFGRDLAIASETERHERRHANAAPHVPGKTSV